MAFNEAMIYKNYDYAQSLLVHRSADQDFQRLVTEYERIEAMLKSMDQQILSLLSEIPIAAQLQSIKGLGPIFVAAILAGAGDLQRYAHGSQLLRKAGLNLAESTSGKRKGQIVMIG
ncbi:transposase [Paenibacillus filicis]|uniref:Transposase n=1 Tax=Paenibacillus gyeongsangnamensis TaxID=3388067 RepID=A0ABT4QKT9_9BACL|nr:transposase [Paenibacillus filicis]MCZ8517483.1 transposase [Paenibacillus filicis]